MKRLACLLAILILITTCFAGCIYDSDGHVALEKLHNLVSLIENNKQAEIKKLFAPSQLEKVSNIDEQIDAMCNYYTGKRQSTSGLGLGTQASYNYGKTIKYHEMSYFVHTIDDTYLFSILWYVKDDYDSTNIGIWSIVVEKIVDENDITPLGEWQAGIRLR